MEQDTQPIQTFNIMREVTPSEVRSMATGAAASRFAKLSGQWELRYMELAIAKLSDQEVMSFNRILTKLIVLCANQVALKSGEGREC